MGEMIALQALRTIKKYDMKIADNFYTVKTAKEKGSRSKLACYREVDNELMHYRRKMEKTSYIDFTSYKALPMDPVNCLEKEQTDYTKADAILEGGAFNLNIIFPQIDKQTKVDRCNVKPTIGKTDFYRPAFK